MWAATMSSAVDPACVKAPAACSEAALGEFVAMVDSGGKVSSVGLLQRVRNAKFLSFLRGEGGNLIGVAGLKLPETGYRRRVAAKSGVDLPTEGFRLELGWVFVASGARGGKSKALCEPLLQATPGEGVFATTGTGNLAMQATLEKLGFERVGRTWKSVESDDDLCLFTLTR
jgi:hypothetical protein